MTEPGTDNSASTGDDIRNQIRRIGSDLIALADNDEFTNEQQLIILKDQIARLAAILHHLERRYRVLFNTILGELFVNNLKARFNDKIDLKFYKLLPESAQILYRRLLMHHDRSKTEIHLKKIAEMTGLCDANEVNLKNTVENNILGPLQEHGYIQTYSAVEGLNGVKYIITRKREKSSGQYQNHGSVKLKPRVGKTKTGGR